MKKILITGAAGFIGSHVAEVIFQKFKNDKLVLYDKITYAANIKYLKNIINSNRVYFVKDDLLNYKILEKKSKKCRYSYKCSSREPR